MRSDRGSACACAVTLFAASLLLLLPLALAACGDSGSATPSPAAASMPTVAASPSPSWSPTMAPATIPKVKAGQVLPFKELAAMFAYDKARPLNVDLQPDSSRSQPGTTVETISYAYGDDKTASGYLVTPEGDGPFPVVVYAPGWTTDVSMYFDDAAALAKKGFAGLLLQEAPSLRCWTFDPEIDCRGVIDNVTQERRGLDVLHTLPQIDTTRIGFVGWSNGAHLLGGVMAGVDERVKAYALIGMARPATNYAGLGSPVPKGAKGDRIRAQLALWDPVSYLGHSGETAFLFINGDGDVNAMRDAKAFMAAAPRPKAWKVYDGGHALTPEAATYLQKWLEQNL
jgi:dienelactone hydrolase